MSAQEKNKAYINRNWLCASRDGNVADMAKWLAQGADIDFPDILGQTALGKAAQSSNAPVVAFLIDKGADINAKDAQGNTPLHVAHCSGVEMQCVKLLLDAGADLKQQNNQGITPFARVVEFIASRYGHESAAMMLMFERGADIYAKTATGQTVAELILNNPKVCSQLVSHIQAKIDKDIIVSHLNSSGAPSRISKL